MAAGIEGCRRQDAVAWETARSRDADQRRYNANPGSTRAAIGLIKGVGDGTAAGGCARDDAGAWRRRDRCHDDISRLALESGADVIAGVGDFAASLCGSAQATIACVTAETVEELWPLLVATDAA